MSISYAQTGTSATFNIGCSGQTAGATTAGRLATVGGSAGGAVTVDPGLGTTAAIFIFECDIANQVGDWLTGDYVCPVNISTCDAGTQFTRADLCDYDGSSFATVVGNIDMSTLHTRGNTGVVTVTANIGSPYTPQGANSRLFWVLTFNNNDPHGQSSVDITPDQTITTQFPSPPEPWWIIRRPRRRIIVGGY